MEEIVDAYLRQTDVVRLHPVFNHVIRSVYLIIKLAFRNQAEWLIATETGLQWGRDEAVLGTFPGREFPRPEMGYDEALHRIVKYDMGMAKFLEQVEEETGQAITKCHLIYYLPDSTDQSPRG